VFLKEISCRPLSEREATPAAEDLTALVDELSAMNGSTRSMAGIRIESTNMQAPYPAGRDLRGIANNGLRAIQRYLLVKRYLLGH